MRIAFLFFALFFAAPLQTNAKALGESIRRERGAFTIGFMISNAEYRLLNQDATFANYRGVGYSGLIDVRLLSESYSELRAFGSISKNNLKSPSTDGNELANSDSLVGLKAYVNPMLFLGIGYGENTQTLTTSVDSLSLKNNVIGIGAGIEFPVSSSLVLGLHAWYKANPLKKENSLGGNSFSEGYDVGLVLMWSPPSVTTILTSGGN
ncbi:MAG: hypothetical protein IPM97_10955 [Bdellovibrionaceae bacterium]|nr:hypothetical protein [Pseudobdellovibrionaceae bacterium]